MFGIYQTVGNHKQLKSQGPQVKRQKEHSVPGSVLKFLFVYPTHAGERKENVLCPSNAVPFPEVSQPFAHSENFVALLLIHTKEELNFALQYTFKAAC